MIDVIVLAVVAVCLFLCIRYQIRTRKKGGSSCGCGCSGCSGCAGASSCGREDGKF